MMNRCFLVLLSGALLVLAGCDQDLVGPTDPAFFATVAVGSDHSCAIGRAGAAYCWGAGRNGQIGDSGMKDRGIPSQVQGNNRVWQSITAGGAHSCAVTVVGEALCWGWNALGQLGIGEAVDVGSPATVAGGHEWAELSSGWYHTCGLTTGGEAYCWGHNRQGQLGNGTRVERELAPVPVAGGVQFSTLSSGAQHSCGVAVDGTAYCWGLNQFGQLGGHPELSAEIPVVAWPNLRFREVSAGVGHTCGITPEGHAYCWGQNESGELGNGSIDRPGLHRVGTPVIVYGGLNFRSISAGNAVSCGIASGDRAVCWGRGLYGQLGTGLSRDAATPQRVGNNKNFTGVSAAGLTHICGISKEQALYCWGSGERGQLGAGGATAAYEPFRIIGVR